MSDRVISECEKMECEICNITYKQPRSYRKHTGTIQHNKRLKAHNNRLAKEEERQQLKLSENYVFNVKGQEVFLNKDVYHFLLDNKIGIFISGGYAYIKINGIHVRLHRFIYYVFYKNIYNEDKPDVDHINQNKLDERIENLRDCTKSDNNLNKPKLKNKTTDYKHIHYIDGSYKCVITINDHTYSYSYKELLHAVYHRELLIKEHNAQDKFELYHIQKPVNFVRKVHHVKKSGLPVGIWYNKSKGFYYNIKNKRVYSMSLEQAIIDRDNYIARKKEDEILKILSEPIKRDNNGVAILELYNIKKEKVGETQVDDNKYYELMMGSWTYDEGYVNGRMNKKRWCLSRYLMNCTNLKLYVDHIDGNPLNNRICNLRIVTPHKNAQNRGPNKNSKTGYVGITKTKRGKYVARLSIKGKMVLHKTFNTKLEAVIYRDMVAAEYNKKGENFRMNNINYNDKK